MSRLRQGFSWWCFQNRGIETEALLAGATPVDVANLERNRDVLMRLAGLGSIAVLDAGQSGPIAAVAVAGSLEILVPMAGLIEPAAELERLAKRRRKAEGDLQKIEAKLGNAEVAANAPPEVVAKDRARVEELRNELAILAAQAGRVGRLLAS